MPQMAPMNWLVLFLYFTIIFILFNMMNYYSVLYKSKFSMKTKKSTLYNWKW